MIQLYDDIEAIQSEMQLIILEWWYLIKITGGCLAPDKSAWRLVDYGCEQGKWKCTNSGQEKILEATNKAGEIVPLW